MKTSKQNNIHQLRLENWYFDLIDEGRQHIFQGYTVYTSAWISDGQRGNEKWNINLRIEFENCLPNIFFSFSVCSSALGIKEGKMSRKKEKKKNFLKPWGTFQPITNMAAAALLRVLKKKDECVCVLCRKQLSCDFLFLNALTHTQNFYWQHKQINPFSIKTFRDVVSTGTKTQNIMRHGLHISTLLGNHFLNTNRWFETSFLR
jgi:hypothetical protein